MIELPITSDAASIYVRTQRRADDRDANWFDVARAYDAGLKHGVQARISGLRELARLREKEKP